MAIHVALEHQRTYRFDRVVRLAPHVVRLRPAPHCRTPVLSYSLPVQPGRHVLNWQQDPYSNYLGRLVFPSPTKKFKIGKRPRALIGLGSKQFGKVAAGRQRTIKVKLSRAGLRLLRSHKTLTANATARVVNPGGITRVRSRQVMLKRG